MCRVESAAKHFHKKLSKKAFLKLFFLSIALRLCYVYATPMLQ